MTAEAVQNMVLATVFIFQESEKSDVLARPAVFPSHWYDYTRCFHAHVYTEAPIERPDAPEVLHIVQDTIHFEFTQPQLVQIQGEQTLLRAFEGHVSGTSAGAKLVYILIIPRDR